MSQILVTGEAKIRDIQGPVVANDGVITALDGAANQYVRGDGTLASFPTSGGGGSSVSYYLNGSVNQGTFGGSTYYQMSKNAITGSGTNFSTSSDGLLAQFITDANDPDVVSIPSGNWNVEFFMSVSASSGSLASFYVEIYKYDGSTFTLLATNVATPEQLTNTTTTDAYFTSVAMPLSAMALTDRLAVRIYANVASKTVTLYTEDNRLCQVVTTFSKGILSINNLTDQSQNLTTGTSGTNFAIVSSGDTHTFNLPVASATNTGKLSSTDWSTFNGKVPYIGATANVDLGLYEISAQNAFLNGVSGINGGNLFLRQDIDFGQSAGYTTLYSSGKNLGFVSYVGSFTYNALFSLNSLTNNSTRTYTLPDLSGTLALLEGSQTFTGIKTFNLSTINETGIQLKNDIGIVPVVSGYTNLNGLTNGLAITNSSGVSNNLLVPATTGYSYTFPAASGTIALTSNLAGYLPLTGGTLTGTLYGTFGVFSNVVSAFSISADGSGSTSAGVIQFKPNPSVAWTTGYVAIAAQDLNTLGFYFSGSFSAYFNNSALTNGRTYTLPDSSGTLALTSNLSSYVPYTGATANVVLGNNDLFSRFIFIDGNGSVGGVLGFKQYATSFQATDGYTNLWATSSNKLNFTFAQTGGSSKNFNFDVTSLTIGSTRAYTLPDASGTIALTSNLSSYLPLTGGTLTGALSGTSATFSGNLGIGGISSADIIGYGTSGILGILGAAGNPASIQLGVVGTAAATTTLLGDVNVFGLNGGSTVVARTIIRSALDGATNSTKMDFFTMNSGSLTSKLTIASTGAATFSSSVTMAYGGNPRLTLQDTDGGSGNVGILFKESTNEKWTLASVGGAFQFFNEATLSNALYITASNNVGIGTTSPAQKLDVSGIIRASGDFEQTGNNVFKNTSYDLYLQTDAASGGIIFRTASATERMRITSGGLVSIGLTGGTGRVNVQANPSNNYQMEFFNTVGGSVGSITVVGGGLNTAYNTSSDYRLKEDLKEYNGLSIISRLKTYDFKWKDTDLRDYGVMAHELAEVLPNYVNGEKDALDESGNIKSQGVDYSKIVPILVKAIQELSQELNELKAKI